MRMRIPRASVGWKLVHFPRMMDDQIDVVSVHALERSLRFNEYPTRRPAFI